MCACDEGLRPAYTCPRCVGTWLDPRYPELPDSRADQEAARYAAGDESIAPEQAPSTHSPRGDADSGTEATNRSRSLFAGSPSSERVSLAGLSEARS